MKAAIVGPQLSKWKPEQIPKVNYHIWDIFRRYGILTRDRPSETEEIWHFEPFRQYGEVIFVSGHCPKGGVDIWAEEIADKLGIKKEIYPAEVNQWPDRITEIPFSKSEVYIHKIDTKGLRFDGYYYYCPFRQIGFKSRNIKIAQACDVLHCIVPYVHLDEEEKATLNNFCVHCEKPNHPTNGGCWTRQYAKLGLGKETYLEVIQ